MAPHLDNSEYTVGWITALYHERAVAEAMLDEEHAPPLQKHVNDHNIYSLGSIDGPSGKHNVVIASLPSNRYGTTPAATAAAQMLSSFPAIKFGLMVGIGGGIPSDDNDIRLGDVVVGNDNTSGGVRQYDTGKFTTNGFEEHGALNSPPRVLLNAVNVLRSKHEKEDSAIPALLEVMLKKYPRMAKPKPPPAYVYQGAEKDRLFQPDYVHATGKRDCSQCDRESEVQREKRLDSDPYVHYGTIASGNIVIKNAQIRDRLSDCLCFETEAAGLMNDFPCLVIRGICDYCDSHKNDMWQKYAAATAAAYAKELLNITDVVDVNSTPEARTVMAELQDLRSITDKIVSRVEEQHLNKKQKEIYEWLSPLNPSTRHFESHNIRAEGTGSWFLEGPEFLSWSSATPRFQKFCCYGDAGAGKTIISSLVIDELAKKAATEEKVGLAYIYFDYQEQKKYTVENTFGTIIKQLLVSRSEIQQAILDQCETFKSQGGPLTSENAKSLFLTTCAQFNRVYICLDALDELEYGTLRTLLKSICDGPSVQYFLTGRGFVQGTVLECFQDAYNITIKAHESDIRVFIEHEIGGPNDIAPTAMNENLKSNIIDKVTDSADGIFLLPVFQIRSVLQQITMRDRLECLAALPSDLGEAFAGTMARIQQQPNKMSELAQKVIVWVHLAEQPLNTDDLLSLLAVKDDDASFDPSGKPEPDILLRCCHGLLVVDKNKHAHTVRMVHYSLQEYLSGQDEIFDVIKQQWHSRIACTCLTFLNIALFEHWRGSSGPRIVFRYASTQWGHHLRKSNELPGPAFELAKTYLDTCRLDMSPSLRLLMNPGGSLKPGFDPTTNLSAFIVAIFGLEKITLHLSQKTLDLDSTDLRGRTPLSYAAENGREAVVKILIIEIGAKVDSVDKYHETPLFKAAENGHHAIANLLIENGAKVDSVNKDHETPLFGAAAYGHETVVELLLKNDAKVDSLDIDGTTPLFRAAANGHEAVIKALIINYAIADLMDNKGRTPLTYAAEKGHGAVTKILLENYAAVNAVDKEGWAPLVYAAKNGHEEVTKILIGYDATVDLQDKEGRTPLAYAAKNGCEEVTKILIGNHAAVDLMDKKGRTPLSWAATMGHGSIICLLLKEGAKVDSVDKESRTPLAYAAENGDGAATKILIENGAAVSLVVADGRTLLSWAASKGWESVVRLLLEKGAEVNKTDRRGRTPLFWAVAGYYYDGMPKLKWKCYKLYELNPRAGEKWMQVAQVSPEPSYDRIIKMLLEWGAVVDVRDTEGQTIMSVAALAVPKDILESLLVCRKDQGYDRKFTIKCLSESQ